ncbi:MAG: NAD(P)-dependent oxidoreductase [Candidatus Dormibacteria bacterium]
MPSGPRVGFIGLGVMGLPMARHLRANGFTVAGWARRGETVARAGAAGLEMRSSPAAVASDADFVVTMVTTSTDVEDLALGTGGVLAAMPRGSILVDMSTVAPATSRRLHSEAERAGVGFLDAPVSGGSHGAEAGTLSIMVGGEVHIFERCRALFSAMGAPERLFHVGPAGSGQVVKLVNNMLVGAISAATMEALLVGVRAGVPLATLVEVVSVSSGASAQLSGQMSLRGLSGNFEPGFATDLLAKDLRLAAELAAEVGAETRFNDLAIELFSALQDAGHGRADYTALLRQLDVGLDPPPRLA